MKRQLGVSLAELGLILALVVLAAIPAVMFLGNTISDGLNNAGTSVQGADVFALMDAPANDPYAGGANIAVATTSVDGSGSSIVSGDGTVPDFGNGFETGSMGTLTTSANGTEMAADALDAMASGQPVNGMDLKGFFGDEWGTVSSMLGEMANAGHNIATAEYDSLVSPMNIGNNLNAIQDTYTQDLASKYVDMYNYLTTEYGADFATNGPAEVQALWSMVNNSAGIISYGAESFVNQVAASGDYNSASYDSSNSYKLTENLVGTAFAEGDVYYIPVVTEEAATTLAN